MSGLEGGKMIETTLELRVARVIARDMVEQGIDLNEAGKALAYVRSAKDWRKCLTLMQRLAQTGAIRSNQTRRYYQAIYNLCRKHIGSDATVEQAGRILGWSVRLARLPRVEKLEQSTQAAPRSPLKMQR